MSGCFTEAQHESSPARPFRRTIHIHTLRAQHFNMVLGVVMRPVPEERPIRIVRLDPRVIQMPVYDHPGQIRMAQPAIEQPCYIAQPRRHRVLADRQRAEPPMRSATGRMPCRSKYSRSIVGPASETTARPVIALEVKMHRLTICGICISRESIGAYKRSGAAVIAQFKALEDDMRSTGFHVLGLATLLGLTATSVGPAVAQAPAPNYQGRVASSVAGCPQIIWRLSRDPSGAVHGMVWYDDLSGMSAASGSAGGGRFQITLTPRMGHGPSGQIYGTRGSDGTINARMTGAGCANATFKSAPVLFFGGEG
jgi:hypothetical protein